MSNLSELLPAGAGAKSASFVASGTLGSGVTVALQSDGTVEVVGETAIPQAVGTPVVFAAAASRTTSTVFDSSSNKVVIAYRSALDKGVVVVGTVSGTSISFGSEVVFENAFTQYIASTYDSTSEKVVVAYADAGNSGYGTAIVGTVSGTSISFGSATVFESANTGDISATYDANSGKVVISYFDSGNSSYGTAVVGTVSGTSISFGSATVFNSAQSDSNFVTYDSNAQKVVIAYRDRGNSNYGTAIVGTVSGTSISFGAESVFNSNLSTDVSSAYDANAQKVVIAYRDYGNSSYGTAVVGTVSGTNISFGSATVFNAGTSDNMAVVYDANAQKIVIPYTDTANSNYGTLVVGTISGTSISFGAETVFEAATATDISSAYDANAKKVVISYKDATNSEYGTSVVFQNASTTTNNTDFIGITDQAIADTATGAVIVQGGVSEKLSGLTVGADYYVQADGSLTSPTAPFPYVIDGATFIQSFSIAAQETEPQGLFIKPDGTEIYISGGTGQGVDQYTLSTAYDLSTASYTAFYSTSAQGANPRGIFFSSDGTKMFECQASTQDIKQYTLSTAWDITTASFDSVNFVISGQVTGSRGVCFNQAGTRMYAVGSVTSVVAQYDLGTAWNISTAAYNSVSFNFSAQASGAESVFISSDGLTMLVGGSALYKYALSSAFDVSSAVYSESFDAGSGDFVGVNFSSDGTKFYYTQYSGTQSDTIQEYSSGVGSATSVPAGRALSTTSILLEG